MLRWLGVGIVILSLYYVGRSLMDHFDQVLALEWGPRAIGVTIAATIVYSCSLVVLAVSWTVIAVAALPDCRQLIAATRIYARTSIAKYLPGNVFHMVGRQVFGRSLGVSQGRLAVATAAEIALSLLSVWLISAAVFVVLPGPVSRDLSLLALAVGLIAAVAFTWPNLSALPWAKRILDRAVGRATTAELALALALNLMYFLCLAIIAGSVFHALTDEPLPLMQVGAVYLSAWLIGYVVPGASAGIGVREATLLALIGESAGEPAALALALVMRLQNVVGDLLFFAASFALPSTKVPAPHPANPKGPAS